MAMTLKAGMPSAKISGWQMPECSGALHPVLILKPINTLRASNSMLNSGILRAAIVEESEPVWADPIKLFNGNDLKGWHAIGKNQWVADAGMLRSPASGSNIETDQYFKGFKLHVEFRYPKGSNSGGIRNGLGGSHKTL